MLHLQSQITMSSVIYVLMAIEVTAYIGTLLLDGCSSNTSGKHEEFK